MCFLPTAPEPHSTRGLEKTQRGKTKLGRKRGKALEGSGIYPNGIEYSRIRGKNKWKDYSEDGSEKWIERFFKRAGGAASSVKWKFVLPVCCIICSMLSTNCDAVAGL